MNCKLILSATEAYQLNTIPSTYLELKQTIESKFAPETAFPFKLKYKDGEDELITLNSEEDLQTAVITCQIENLKSLDIYVLRDEVNQSVISEPSQAEEKGVKVDNGEAITSSFYESALFRGFAYSLPQTRKMSTDTSQTFDLEDVLSNTDMLSTYGCRPSMGNLNRKSKSPGEKKTDYKVQFKSKFEYDTLQVIAGEQYTYSFTMKNCGETQWPKNIKLVCVNGIHKKQEKNVPSLRAGEKCEIGLILTAAEQVGKQLSQWRLHYEEADGSSKGFGRTFFIETNNTKRQIIKKAEVERSNKQQIPFVAKTCSSESEDYKRVLELGEALNDMFPGDLKGKVKFVESCPDHYSIYDLVDNYLLSLRGDNTKFSQNNYIIA